MGHQNTQAGNESTKPSSNPRRRQERERKQKGGKTDQERLRSPYQNTRGARQDGDANHRNGGKTDRPDQARRRGGEEKEKGKR